MPKETLVNPASASRRRLSRLTDSGLASVVTSAPARSPKAESRAARTPPSWPGSSIVGVPPPKNAVSRSLPSPRRTRRLRAISPASDPGKSSTDAPVPMRRFVYVLKSQYPHLTAQKGMWT